MLSQQLEDQKELFKQAQVKHRQRERHLQSQIDAQVREERGGVRESVHENSHGCAHTKCVYM